MSFKSPSFHNSHFLISVLTDISPPQNSLNVLLFIRKRVENINLSIFSLNVIQVLVFCIFFLGEVCQRFHQRTRLWEPYTFIIIYLITIIISFLLLSLKLFTFLFVTFLVTHFAQYLWIYIQFGILHGRRVSGSYTKILPGLIQNYN